MGHKDVTIALWCFYEYNKVDFIFKFLSFPELRGKLFKY